MRKSLRRALITLLGLILVALGIAALILPGPGLLLLLAGLVVLSQEFEWAGRRVEPVKEKAFDVARAGVSSYPRIVMSALGALILIAIGIVCALNPKVPEVGPIGPDLPFGGWATGSSIGLSGLIALGLLVYSIKRFRGEVGEGSLSGSAQSP